MPNYSVETKGNILTTVTGGSPDPVGEMDVSGNGLGLYLNNIVGIKGHLTAKVKRMDTGATIHTVSCNGGENALSTWGVIFSGLSPALNGCQVKIEWSFGGTIPANTRILDIDLGTDLTGSYDTFIDAQGNGFTSGQALFNAPAGY
jgi:hypothetical protein